MKTLGLLGGMSWESTATYYRLINEAVRDRLGGLHSSRMVLYSVDFEEVEVHRRQGRWDQVGLLLGEAARSLEAAGAQILLMCCNTMHEVAPQIQAATSLPFLHIAQVTGDALVEAGLKKVALLGTRHTMAGTFYREAIEARDIQVLVPDEEDQEAISRIIYEELCLGIIRAESKSTYLAILDKLAGAGAQGCILGCTEIGLLIQKGDTPVPLFDTTIIHAHRAVQEALK